MYNHGLTDDEEFGAVGLILASSAIATAGGAGALIARRKRIKNLISKAQAGDEKAKAKLRKFAERRLKVRDRRSKRLARLYTRAMKGNKIAKRRYERLKKIINKMDSFQNTVSKFGADDKQSQAGSALIGILAGVGFLFALPFIAKSSFDEANQKMRENMKDTDFSRTQLPMI